MWERRWVRWGLILGVWTILGLLLGSQNYVAQALSERPIGALDAFSSQLLFSTLWALSTPPVLWLATRFPLDRQHLLKHLGLHLLFSIVFAIAVAGLFQITYFLIFVQGLKPYSPVGTLRTIVWNASEDIGIYGLILFLHHAFTYYHRYRAGELRSSQLETQLAQSQLQALKMQLHPHFLFNTLHSISALVHHDADTADRMISRLGDFLRLTLDNSGSQEVSLQRELEFLKCYLEIERIRFRDRLTTEFRIEPQALDSAVPNLILQPIVENAIRHGIAPRAAPGRVEISAERQNGSLRLRVRDNGPGLSVNPTAQQTSKEGLGLRNTRARLARLYGDAHRFELSNDPEGGLIVTLEIPFRPE
ncbi:MAG: sensor histidine kinase [Pyrinomonadaceae bacterium]